MMSNEIDIPPPKFPVPLQTCHVVSLLIQSHVALCLVQAGCAW